MFDASVQTNQGLQAEKAALHNVALIGNFPPRRCGIATFTADLFSALKSAHPSLCCEVIAMNDGAANYAYGSDVTFEIGQDDPQNYVEAADVANRGGAQVVCLQHEFGIFGGAAGANLLTFVAGLRAPLVTTFHTVLEHPNDDQRGVIDKLITQSSRLVVMSRKGREILTRVYGAPRGKIAVVPHGAPDRPLQPTSDMKRRFGWEDRDVLLTFGLLSPNKGIESVIRALPRIVEARPNALYVVVGATHPHMIAREGEAYRERLAALAEELGVTENLLFVNSFVDTELLLDYLTAADVYVTPYLNRAQITSGTLAYAVALGKPVVSTPYWHAEELLADGVGELTPFNDSDAIGESVTRLLSDDNLRRAQAERAYERGRDTTWLQVGERYIEVFEEARAEWRSAEAAKARRGTPLPAMSLKAVERLSDATGMLQHARFAVPDRDHGYCVDDNARALILTQRMVSAGLQGPPVDRLAYIYAAFVEHAWNPDRNRFRNFMSYERAWLEDEGSQDSFGRTLWALGETALLAKDPELKAWAAHLGERSLAHAEAMAPLRATAFSLLGECALAATGDIPAREAAWRASHRLLQALRENKLPDWVWFEPSLGYDNARLPEALLRAAALFNDRELRDAGIDALEWLTIMHTAPSGRFRAVGSESFNRPYELPALFDQQPLEAAAAVDACWAAFDVTGDQRWRHEAYRAFAWFLGDNDLGVRVADVERGGCFDGLHARGPNRNQGAESVLAYQLALCAMRVRERPRRPAPVR
ncbi:MAG: glycosyltransferase family 4 protein [Vitreimonas sp.]